MTINAVPRVKFQLGEKVKIPTGKGRVQFWYNDGKKITLAVSQMNKQPAT